jgi:hypothetical protein
LIAQVYSHLSEEGEVLPFDGGELSILNFNNRILIAHELLEEFLTNTVNQRATFKGWFRSKVQVWLSNQVGSEGS